MKSATQSVAAMTAMLGLLVVANVAAAQANSTSDGIRSQIWQLEQSIYAGRSNGDSSNYLRNASPDYVSWPPTAERPLNLAKLKATNAGVPLSSRERVTLEFIDIAIHRDTAVIYYTIHRTQHFDGSPANEIFEISHTWVRDGGKWHVLGGMARLEPKR